MKNYIYTFILFVIFLCGACNKNIPTYEQLTDSKEGVYLYISKALTGGKTIQLHPNIEASKANFNVNYGGLGLPVSEIEISIQIDKVAMDSINMNRKLNGMSEYKLMPEEAFSLDKNRLLIPSGKVNSDFATISFDSSKLDLTNQYILALRATNDKQYAFYEKGDLLVFYVTE